MMPSLTNPRQVVFVTARAERLVMGRRIEKDSITMTTWHMPISLKPRNYAVAIANSDFSNNLIKESNVFCVNFIAKTFEKYAQRIDKIDGENFNRYEALGLAMEECNAIDCGRIKDVLGFAECEVIAKHDFSDHSLYIGKVVKSELKKVGKRLFQIDERTFTTTD